MDVTFHQKLQPKSSFSYSQQSGIIQSAAFPPLSSQVRCSFTNQRTNSDTPWEQIFTCLTEFKLPFHCGCERRIQAQLVKAYPDTGSTNVSLMLHELRIFRLR